MDPVLQVNFMDRLLQGKPAHRKKSASHRRKRAPTKAPAETAPTGAPMTVPVPLPKPANEDAAPKPAPEPEVQVPQPKPENSAPPSEQLKKDEVGAETAPKTEKPETGTETGKVQDEKPVDQKPQPDEEEGQPEIVHEDAAALKQCLSDLAAVGAKFQKIDPIDEGNGCGIEQPLKIDDVLPGIALGGAVMRCQTALDLAHWLKNTVQPAFDVATPGRKVVGLVPGSTFACRLRNNASTGMISEHARGTAFDVAGFKLDNGETLEMKPRQDDHTMEGALQKAVTAGACLYFTTVLAPGSDAAHETHMHVDIKDRESGYRICELQ